MVGFVLAELGDLLKQVGLYHSVRAMQYVLINEKLVCANVPSILPL